MYYLPPSLQYLMVACALDIQDGKPAYIAASVLSRFCEDSLGNILVSLLGTKQNTVNESSLYAMSFSLPD